MQKKDIQVIYVDFEETRNTIAVSHRATND